MIRNRHNQVPDMTQDIVWKSDKNTRRHHTHESQEISPFRAGDHKAARNTKYTTTKTTMKHKNKNDSIQKKHRLGTVSKTLLGSFNMLNGTNLVLKSDVEQDT